MLTTAAEGDLPKVAWMPTKFIEGANNLTDSCPALSVSSFLDTFIHPYDSDAHFVTYKTTGTGSTIVYPRCNKPLLFKMRAIKADIVTTMLVLDYDNIGHTPWTETKLSAFYDQLQAVADDWPVAWGWTLFYLTRNGARFVYVLDHPIPADEAEAKHLWLCQEFNRRGVAIDKGVSDWTRVFRLPYVTRDKELTWESPFGDMHQQLSNRLIALQVPNGEKESGDEYGNIESLEADQPERQYALDLIEYRDPTTGSTRQTDWYKEAKRRLKGRECFDCLFGHKPMADHGSRDTTLHSYVGQAVTMLFNVPGTTPDHVYGLFLEPTEQLEPDTQTPDWLACMWSHVCRIWPKEAAKVNATLKEVQAKAEEATELFQRIIGGMKLWSRDATLHDANEEVALAWAMRRLIVSCGKNYYIMGTNGYYDPMQLNDRQLIPRIRITGLDGLIETKALNDDGTVRDQSVNILTNTYATVVRDVRAIPSIDGAFIEDLDKPTSRIVLPAYQRSKELVPCYNPDVDEWLQKLFGENYEVGTRWISWALAFEEGPICALSLAGRQGSGKKLFARGLAECLQQPALADANDLTSGNQYGLLESPFLCVNEGWPGVTSGGMHPADRFRMLVAGDPIRCNTKYNHPIEVCNPCRIIFTANNLSVIQMLSKGRDLSPEDREALSLRLLHFNIDDQASDWLRIKGGVRFTSRAGQRWIKGDGGEPSDFIVARHFLWLYANRKGPCGARFLVEGNDSSEIMFSMRTQSGTTPLVIETIISLVNSPRNHEGCVISDGKLHVLTSEILSHFRADVAESTRERLTSQQISNVLRSLCTKEHKQPFVVKNRESIGRKRWHELDCRLLKNVAERDGWSCPQLEALCIEQEQRENGTYVESSPKEQKQRTEPGKIINFFAPVTALSAVTRA